MLPPCLGRWFSNVQTLLDFNIISVLGKGSFGRVFLVQNAGDNTKKYACKVISKQRTVKQKQVEHTVNEKNLLFCCNSSFVVKMHDYFHDRQHIYLILEYIVGGELFDILQHTPTRKFSIAQAKFISGKAVHLFLFVLFLSSSLARAHVSRGGAWHRVPALAGHHLPRPQAREHSHVA